MGGVWRCSCFLKVQQYCWEVTAPLCFLVTLKNAQDPGESRWSLYDYWKGCLPCKRWWHIVRNGKTQSQACSRVLSTQMPIFFHLLSHLYLCVWFYMFPGGTVGEVSIVTNWWWLESCTLMSDSWGVPKSGACATREGWPWLLIFWNCLWVIQMEVALFVPQTFQDRLVSTCTLVPMGVSAGWICGSQAPPSWEQGSHIDVCVMSGQLDAALCPSQKKKYPIHKLSVYIFLFGFLSQLGKHIRMLTIFAP